MGFGCWVQGVRRLLSRAEPWQNGFAHIRRPNAAADSDTAVSGHSVGLETTVPSSGVGLAWYTGVLSLTSGNRETGKGRGQG